MQPRPGPSRPSTAPSAVSHRYQGRRQERMRGAGTREVIPRNFTFTAAAPSASSKPNAPTAAAAAPSSSDRYRAGPGLSTPSRNVGPSTTAPSSAGPLRSAMRGARAREAAGFEAASSSSVSRQQTSLPYSSTPGQHASRRSVSYRRPDHDDDDDQRGPLSDDGAMEQDASVQVYGDMDVEMPAMDEDYDDVDVGSSSRAVGGDDGGRRLLVRPPSRAVGGDSRSVARRGRGGSSTAVGTTRKSSAASAAMTRRALPDLDQNAPSPGSNAAQRRTEARQTKRQADPGDKSSSAAKGTSGKGRAAQRMARTGATSTSDLGAERRSAREAASAAAAAATTGQRRAMERRLRLKRVVGLALGAEAQARGRGRSRSRINDADVAWSVVGKELGDAYNSQPISRVAKALRGIRRSAKRAFERLSTQWSERAELIEQLKEARKRKRELRERVWETRSALLEVRDEVERLEKREERERERKEKEQSMTSFLADLRQASVDWS